MNAKRNSLVVILGYTMLVLVPIVAAIAIGQDDADTTDLAFVNHLQAGMVEQDVFVLNEAGEAVRVDNTFPISTLYQPVVTTTEAQAHDPLALFENPYGPFESGPELGFTLAEWLGASATGRYTVIDEETSELIISAKGLVPNGVYTVWCARMIPPPDFRFIDLPCGAEDGSQNIFTATSNGTFNWALAMTPLDPAVADNMPIIALAYHSDGFTYGASPGEFGKNSHVQLFALITPTETE